MTRCIDRIRYAELKSSYRRQGKGSSPSGSGYVGTSIQPAVAYERLPAVHPSL